MERATRATFHSNFVLRWEIRSDSSLDAEQREDDAGGRLIITRTVELEIDRVIEAMYVGD